MNDVTSRYPFLHIAIQIFLILPAGCLILLAGCSSQSGQGGADPLPPLVEQTYKEDCILCHGPGNIVDVEDAHATEPSNIRVSIDSVSEADETTDPGGVPPGETRLKIQFRLFQNGTPVALFPAGNIRFALAKLISGPTDSDPSDWQSYINTSETKEPGDPGTAPDGTTATQATAERASANGGVFTDLQDGRYSYIFSFDMNSVTDPVAGDPIPYERNLTHRVAMQVSGNIDNAFIDFVPDGGAVSTRDISANASCNECHIKLGLHGGDRIAIQYCVTCHNPGSADANSGNTVDLKVMIHKIHTGELLPEVQAGGEYAIWGFQNSKNDYSDVIYPQDLRNCEKCHDGNDAATPDGDNWKNVPGEQACTSCHGAIDSPEYPNFPNLTPNEIEQAHEIRASQAAERFAFNLIGVENTGPGEFPVVTFSVTDPTVANRPYDIQNDPEFTAGGGVSRLAILIGWKTVEYTNRDSESTPAQPISINPLAEGVATANPDGSFSVTSPVAIPAAVTGSGAVAIEGHPADETIPGSGVYDLRVPVKNAVDYFRITDVTAEPRRQVVDIDKCKECHGVLSLHGNNRTDEIGVCVLCHNADATDINRRPGGGAATADGKPEEAIDFKYMVHSIHAGDVDFHGFRQEGIVVYGFGGSVNDFSHVRLPAGFDNLANCAGCHFTSPENTFALSSVTANVLPTTIETREDIASPDDDRNITPISSVCSSCHDSIFAKTHMTENGGSFEFIPFVRESEGGDGSDADLCGPSGVQPGGHTSRTDCCSCHAIQ